MSLDAERAAFEAIEWLDDFVTRCNGDDRGSCESVNIIRRALQASASLSVGVPGGIAEQHAKAMKLLREAHSWVIPKGNISVSIFERIGAFLDSAAATSAPEVRSQQFAKPTLLKDCNVSYSNSSQPLSKHAERQEAVAWRLRLPDGRTTLEKDYPKWAEGEGDGYAIQPLYTSPPPAQDVSGLVEALEQLLDYGAMTGPDWPVDNAREALVAYRKAQG